MAQSKRRQSLIRKYFYSLLALSGIFLWAAAPSQSQEKSPVYVITLDDVMISPVMAEFIGKSIDRATEEGGQALVMELDTPGGLLTSTRIIVKKILSSEIPVIVYVTPSGSRAGSAGVFITYASHIAAMAPSTNIGAAHPVDFGGDKKPKQEKDETDIKELVETLKKEKETSKNDDKIRKQNQKSNDKSDADQKASEDQQTDEIADQKQGEPDETSPLDDKILNDTVAFIKTMAKLRGRNVEWAVKSVTESDSITEDEAIENNVVEILAVNLDDLLQQTDGRTVTINGKDITLTTKDAPVVRIEMQFRERFLNILANPNIAYILMILGFYGLLYEVTHPGVGVPGVLGLIFLILAFYSLQALPTNYAGVALIVLSLVLFASEAFTPGLGLLALGGVICMILGSIILFDKSIAPVSVSMSLVLSFTLTTAVITMFLTRSVLRTHRTKPFGGQQGMIGEVGFALTDLQANQEGKVFVHGETWNAVAASNIKKDEKIRVLEVNGMIVKVEKV